MSVEAGSSLLCLITHPEPGADAFARLLVERGVAACVNRVPVASVFRWQGAIEEGGEVLLVVKTARERLEALERLLASAHPYDVPELVALAPAALGERYARWWRASLGLEDA